MPPPNRNRNPLNYEPALEDRATGYGDKATEYGIRVAQAEPTKQPKVQPTEAEKYYEKFTKKGSVIQLVEGKVTIGEKNGLKIVDKFDFNSYMTKTKAIKFIDRFIVPIPKYKTGKKLLDGVQRRKHEIYILWATGGQKIGLTGTIPLSQKDAANSKVGSKSLVFIDEKGDDWKAVPDFDDKPDIGLLHELYHAGINQQGLNDQNTERKARIIENRYRNERGASSLRKLP